MSSPGQFLMSFDKATSIARPAATVVGRLHAAMSYQARPISLALQASQYVLWEVSALTSPV